MVYTLLFNLLLFCFAVAGGLVAFIALLALHNAFFGD